MKQEQAGLSGDARLDLIMQNKSATAFEVLFREENLQVALQLLLIRRGQPAVKGAIGFHPRPPNRAKRVRTQFLPALTFPHAECRYTLNGLLSSRRRQTLRKPD
jgi:hypothetical protein